jgi:hypothetical protein
MMTHNFAKVGGSAFAPLVNSLSENLEKRGQPELRDFPAVSKQAELAARIRGGRGGDWFFAGTTACPLSSEPLSKFADETLRKKGDSLNCAIFRPSQNRPNWRLGSGAAGAATGFLRGRPRAHFLPNRSPSSLRKPSGPNGLPA